MAEDRPAGESEIGESIEDGFVLTGDVPAEAGGRGGDGTDGGDGALPETEGPPPPPEPEDDETSEDGTSASEGDFLPVDEAIRPAGGSTSNDEEAEGGDAPVADDEEDPTSDELERSDGTGGVGGRPASRQYELLPGLPVVVTDDADVTAASLGAAAGEEGGVGSAPRKFFVSSSRVGLGRGSSFLGPEEGEEGDDDNDGNAGNVKNSCAVVGYDVSLHATIERHAAADAGCGERRSGAALVVRGLDVSIGGGASVDPLADAGHVLAFLREFAGSAVWDEEPARCVGQRRVELPLPTGPLGAEICRSSVDGRCVVRAKVDGSASPLREGDVVESLNGVVLAEVEGGLEAWARMFKASADGERTVVVRRSLPDRRLTLEEWEQFLGNVKSDRRVSGRGNCRTEDGGDEGDNEEENGQKFPPPDAFSPKADILIPNARVGAFALTLPDHKEPIEFPACEGTADCTLRTMLEYYCTAILRTIRDRSYADGKGRGTGKGGGSVTDMASVKGSVVGAAVGGVFLGPVGFLAGSYLGGQFGRKHSGAVVGAAAGACLFGPVGLIAATAAAAAAEAGAASGEPSSRDADARRRAVGGVAASSNEFGASGRPVRSLGESVSSHLSNNKLEYAGTTGVVAGAAVGAIAGPVGMLAGAYAGSVAARKGTEVASDSALETRQLDGRSGYQFGDISRGLVARGKKARGADRNDKYKFGDFTRGLFSG